MSLIQDKITSKTVLFDSRIRGRLVHYSRYEAKQSHWKVGRATSSLLQYTLFCNTEKYKQAWVDFQVYRQPHTDTLLHVNSVTEMSKAHTSRFSCEGFTAFTPEEYKIPKVQPITEHIYHPSGLYLHEKIKPKFILSCVLSPTGFVKRSTTLVEQCSI